MILVLDISLSEAEPSVGSDIYVKVNLRNTGQEEVLMEYFAGQLFEVVIRDDSGKVLYAHSDMGFRRYFMLASLYLRLAPGEAFTKTLKVKLVFSRGVKKGNPLPPRYLISASAVWGQPYVVINGIKAYTVAAATITIIYIRGTDCGLIWSRNIGYWAVTPAVGELNLSFPGLEIAVTRVDGYIYVLKGTDGAIVWNRYIGTRPAGYGNVSSPTIFDVNGDGMGEVYVTGDYIYALRETYGSLIWAYPANTCVVGFWNSYHSKVAIADINKG